MTCYLHGVDALCKGPPPKVGWEMKKWHLTPQMLTTTNLSDVTCGECLVSIDYILEHRLGGFSQEGKLRIWYHPNYKATKLWLGREMIGEWLEKVKFHPSQPPIQAEIILGNQYPQLKITFGVDGVWKAVCLGAWYDISMIWDPKWGWASLRTDIPGPVIPKIHAVIHNIARAFYPR